MKDLSFVIPVLDGEKYLKKCLSAIFNLKTSLSFEVIVVDNGSKDGSIEIAKEFQISFYQEAQRGRSFARNRGLRAAQGKWIAYVDCDTILKQNWLKEMEPVLSGDLFDCLQGKIIPEEEMQSSFSKFRKEFISQQTNGTFCHLDRTLFTGPLCNSAAMIIRKNFLQHVNGFDVILSTYEDADLSWRLWKEGASFCVVNKAIANVYWEKGGYLSYLKRAYQMGKGLSKMTTKWQIKSSLLPSAQPYKFSTRFNQAIYSVFFYFFSLGYLDIRCNLKEEELLLEKPLHQSIVFFYKKIYFNKECLVLKPFVRLLVTSEFLILRNLTNYNTLKIPLPCEDLSVETIKTLLFSNNNIVENGSWGSFLSS